MSKYIIRWNVGYGDSYDEVEAENLDGAVSLAFESWREEAESNADYDAEPWDAHKAYDYGLTDEDPDEEE